MAYHRNYGQFIDQYTMNWECKEAACAYFKQLAALFTQWQELVKTVNRSPGNLADLFAEVAHPFTQRLPDRGPVVLDEKSLYDYLRYRLELAAALGALPPAPALDYEKFAQRLLDDPRMSSLLPGIGRPAV